LNIDKEKIYLELARKRLSVSELCNSIEWSPARFYQALRRGTASVKAVGVISHALGVQPEAIVADRKRFR
jgi:lambda repressor-like predicted transcriptional regulator